MASGRRLAILVMGIAAACAALSSSRIARPAFALDRDGLGALRFPGGALEIGEKGLALGAMVMQPGELRLGGREGRPGAGAAGIELRTRVSTLSSNLCTLRLGRMDVAVSADQSFVMLDREAKNTGAFVQPRGAGLLVGATAITQDVDQCGLVVGSAIKVSAAAPPKATVALGPSRMGWRPNGSMVVLSKDGQDPGPSCGVGPDGSGAVWAR